MATATTSTSTGAQPGVWHTEATWEKLVAQKKESLNADIPKDWRLPASILQKYRPASLDQPFCLNENVNLSEVEFLSENEIRITETSSATELLGKLAKGELTALEVTTAFCKRAAIAGQLVSFFRRRAALREC